MPPGIGYGSAAVASLAGRRKRGLPSKAKAQKIANEGLKSAGDGFHSDRQKGFFGLLAGGGTPTRMRRRRKRNA